MPRLRRSQFHARKSRLAFRFVSLEAARRETRGAPRLLSRYNAARETNRCRDDIAQCGRFSPACYCALRSRVGNGAAAEPRPKTIARGKALTWPAIARAATPPIPQSRSPAASASIRRSARIYSPNLTPDRDTGIGAWSDDDFYRALRYGVAPDGSRYYPAFPYPNFTKLTRDDIAGDPGLSRRR